MNPFTTLGSIAVLTLCSSAAFGEESAQAIAAGVNGDTCLYSAYNCKLRSEGGNRILTNSGSENWGSRAGLNPIRERLQTLSPQTPARARARR